VTDKTPAPTDPAAKKEALPAPQPEPKLEAKPDAKPAPKADDGARARALLDGQAPAPEPAASGAERLVVQVGSFAEAVRAQDVRLKLEKAGLKTYTQVADTKDGKRIRVRVGPFASKAEADKAASKIKTLDLPATILTL
jgi:DedD protein